MKSQKNAAIPVTQFKAHCLEIVETVRRKHTSVVISKHGKPVAKVVPIESEPAPSLYGSMKGTGREIGDIVAPLDEEWNVLRDE